jgi:hypothetical protein
MYHIQDIAAAGKTYKMHKYISNATICLPHAHDFGLGWRPTVAHCVFESFIASDEFQWRYRAVAVRVQFVKQV